MQQFNMFYLLKDLRKLSCKEYHENHNQQFFIFIIIIVINFHILFTFLIYYLFSLFIILFGYFKRTFSCMHF